jgi:hypothetical protein
VPADHDEARPESAAAAEAVRPAAATAANARARAASVRRTASSFDDDGRDDAQSVTDHCSSVDKGRLTGGAPNLGT